MFRSTGGLASILKDSGEVKFSKEEQSLTCCILCTADYCLETTQQVRGLVPKYVALLHFPSLPAESYFLLGDGENTTLLKTSAWDASIAHNAPCSPRYCLLFVLG